MTYIGGKKNEILIKENKKSKRKKKLRKCE